MVIQELKPSKRVRGRWLAVLEDGSLLRVGEGEVIQFALCAGRELTEEEAERLQAAVRTGGLKEKALNLLAGRPMSRRELERKLESWEAAPEEATAICGRLAAERYGLEILEEGIETNKRNFTRFLLLADRYHADRHTGSARADKASLVFSLPHTQGSLSKVLTILSFYDINLTKIQSMPIIGCEWEYRFYVDVSFADYTRYRQSIDAITPLTKDFKILGEYAAFNE